MKSVKPKNGSGEPPAQGGGRNAEADFHGQKRSNDTHASTTDPDARLYRKADGRESRLCFTGQGHSAALGVSSASSGGSLLILKWQEVVA